MTEINEKSAFEVIEEKLADLRREQRNCPSEKIEAMIINTEKILAEKYRNCKASAY